MVKNLSLIIYNILNDDKLKNELGALEDRDQIYDFFTKNGYEGSYEKFCAEMEEFFDLFEISDDDLDSVAGGLGVNSGKIAATALSILSLVSSTPGINAANVSNSKNVSISSSERLEKSSEKPVFNESFLNSFFSSKNRGFLASLKSKFFEKTVKSNFTRIDKLISEFKTYYENNKNNLNMKTVSGMLFNIIKIIESKNPGNPAVKQKAAEAKSSLEKVANKLKSKKEVKPEEALNLTKKVEELYNSASVQTGKKSKKFKSAEELQDDIESLIKMESLKTYKSSASKAEIAFLEKIISGISEYYIDVSAVNGKTFESYIKGSKNYKELMKNKKSIKIKNILKTIKTVCKSDVELKNGRINAVEKEENTTFMNMNKIYSKIKIDENLKETFVRQLNAACDYSDHVYMFEKSDRYEYDSDSKCYIKLEEDSENKKEEKKKKSIVNEDSPYFGYFGDNFAGSVDIIPQGEDEGTVYLAFRGTYSKNDAKIDGNISKAECAFLGKKCVHKGFLKRYLELQRGMKDLLNEKINLYRKQTGKDIKKIVVTGHSLGGALATLAALELQQNDKTTPVKLITFCSPRVLSFEAYDYVIKNNILRQTGENSAVRIYRHGDVIPSMPLGSMGFKHFGEVFCITNAPKGFENENKKSLSSRIKSYFSIDEWKEWAKSFIGYHSITGILDDVSKLGKDKKVTMYKQLF